MMFHKVASTDLQCARPVHEVSCRVISNTPVRGEYRLLILDAPKEVTNCQPGQFFNLLCPQRTHLRPYFRRPMSIYGYYPDKSELHFLYKIAGVGTKSLSLLTKGDFLNIVGPLGHGFEIKNEWNSLLLLARGVGLATLAPLALEAKAKGKKLTAICSARSPDLLMSIEHFSELGANVITVTDEEGTSDIENVIRLIKRKILDEEIDAFFTCGSNRLLKLLQVLAKKYNIPGQVALEQQMACGLGMCQCCVRSFRTGKTITRKRVCKEGPVFEIQEAMAW